MNRLSDAMSAAKTIAGDRYSDSALVLLAGSVVRGQETPHSDLDLLIIYPQLPHARRESFFSDGWPVEAFINDPETLAYFSEELDLKNAEPIMLTMLDEAIVIQGDEELARTIKDRARLWLMRGPLELTNSEKERMRYAITDTLDDIRSPKSKEQLMASGCVLYRQLADCFFRSRSLWCARGKSIPRKMHEVDAAFSLKFQAVFEQLFAGNPTLVIQLTEELLAPLGGTLFDGYKLDAPASFRKKLD